MAGMADPYGCALDMIPAYHPASFQPVSDRSGRNIYVKNLGRDVDEAALSELFQVRPERKEIGSPRKSKDGGGLDSL
jgi:hypothetical protein